MAVDDLSERMTLALNDSMEDGTLESGSVGGDGTTDAAKPEVVTDSDAATALPAVTEVKEEKPAPVDKGVPKDEEDELFKELGLKPRPDKKENRIPYSRVKAITESQRKKAQTEFEAKVKEHTDKVAAYEARLKEVENAENIIKSEPEKYLEFLPTVNPKYKDLIQKAVAAGTIVPPVAAVPATPPPPNVKLEDGSMTYDTEGLQKYSEWQAAQIEARLEKKYSERFGPMEREFQKKKDYEAFVATTMPRINAQLEAAEKWPLFTDNRTDILAALTDKTNPAANLEAAYQRVVLPKLQANKDTMRAELLKELEQKPTQLGTPAIQVAKVPAEMDLEEKMMAQLKADGLTK